MASGDRYQPAAGGGRAAPKPAQATAGCPGIRLSLSERLGPRILPAGGHDVRDRLDMLAESRALEEESSAGPSCFGPRIQREPFLRSFTLPWDSPEYDGSTKPKDWLVDYTTAVGIAGGNKRVVVCYAPTHAARFGQDMAE